MNYEPSEASFALGLEIDSPLVPFVGLQFEPKHLYMQMRRERADEVKERASSKWTAEENTCLLKLKADGQRLSWTQIAIQIARSCGTAQKAPATVSYHYSRALKIRKAGWTAAEDEILKQYFKKYGNRWAQIRQHLDGRSDLQIKYRIGVLFGGIPRQEHYAHDSADS